MSSQRVSVQPSAQAPAETEVASDTRVSLQSNSLGPVRLPDNDLDELRRLHADRFATWDPLANDGKINGLVLDKFDIRNGGNHGETVTERVLSAGRRFVEVDRIPHHHLASIAAEIEQGSRPRPEFVNYSIGPEEEQSIVELSRKIEEWRNTLPPDSRSPQEPLSAQNLFDPEMKQLVKAYFRANEPELFRSIESIERLAALTDGPFTISAGNSGQGTVNPYTFANAPNIVAVGADRNGERADYSSEGEIYVDGSGWEHSWYTSDPVTSERRYQGTVEWPGGVVDHRKEQPLIDRGVAVISSDVSSERMATDQDVAAFLTGHNYQYPSNKYFTAEQIQRVAEQAPSGQREILLAVSQSLQSDPSSVIEGREIYDMFRDQRSPADVAALVSGFEGLDVHKYQASSAQVLELQKAVENGSLPTSLEYAFFTGDQIAVLADVLKSPEQQQRLREFADTMRDEDGLIAGESLHQVLQLMEGNGAEFVGLPLIFRNERGRFLYNRASDKPQETVGTSWAAPEALRSLIMFELENR